MEILVSWLARQKFRFDLGVSFMMVINLFLLSITASGTIYNATGIPAKMSVPIIVPLVILLVWCFGFCLDKVKFFDAIQNELNLRNKMLRDVVDKTKDTP